MILSPAIMALVFGSLLLTFFALYSSWIGTQIILRWDISNGSERQLALERKTYLISTILAYLMGFELFSFFLYVYTADSLHEIFIGAMCAAGSLNAAAAGYPTLIFKIINVLACGIWLVLNHTDNQGYDYPLIKAKYKLLLVITASLTMESILQWQYFSSLKADVIASCCGTLFSENADNIVGDLASISSSAGKFVLMVGFLLMIRTGGYFLWTGKGARLFAWVSTGLFILAIVSIISFISVYFYELPTHHCPFCVLQADYHYIGYPLYLSILMGGIMGAGVGVLQRFQGTGSLLEIIPRAQKKLCWGTILSYTIFAAISIYPMVFSDFKLEGY